MIYDVYSELYFFLEGRAAESKTTGDGEHEAPEGTARAASLVTTGGKERSRDETERRTKKTRNAGTLRMQVYSYEALALHSIHTMFSLSRNCCILTYYILSNYVSKW